MSGLFVSLPLFFSPAFVTKRLPRPYSIIPSFHCSIIPSLLPHPFPSSDPPEPGDVVKDNYFTWEEKLPEILLGESRYYYLVEKDDILSIKETTNPFFPNEKGIIKSADVWGEDAVTVAGVGSNAGKRLGVYWETEKPRPDSSDKLLLPGLIRLVGRYWTADSVYKVTLTTGYGAGSDVTIEVKKPLRLGNTKKRARDVLDREINIDDSCIVYGGRYGIPPHFLKAQISVESPPKTFTFSDGKSESGFAPGYRFEPFTTQFELREEMRNNPFYVLPGSLRKPPPPDHMHVLYLDYTKGAPVKVWYFVENYSQLIDPSKLDVFGERMADGKMDFRKWGYGTIQTHFDSMYNYFRDPRGGSLGLSEPLSVLSSADSARKHFIDFLKNTWKGGLDNIVAQTRIAASYGLFQTVYTTALDRDYPEDDESLPEELNMPGTNLLLSIEYQRSLMIENLGNDFECGNNWGRGLEESFAAFVYYPKWNRRRGYPADVFSRVRDFVPKK